MGHFGPDERFSWTSVWNDAVNFPHFCCDQSVEANVVTATTTEEAACQRRPAAILHFIISVSFFSFDGSEGLITQPRP